MSSNVVHLKKPKGFHPAMGLAMGRTAMRLGRKHGDPGLTKAGKVLFDKSNADLGSPTSDRLDLFSEPGAEASPNLSCGHRSRQPDRRLRGAFLRASASPPAWCFPPARRLPFDR